MNKRATNPKVTTQAELTIVKGATHRLGVGTRRLFIGPEIVALPQ